MIFVQNKMSALLRIQMQTTSDEQVDLILTCRSVNKLLVSLTRDLVASSSIFSFSCVSLRQVIWVWAEPRFCSFSLTSSWRWDTCNSRERRHPQHHSWTYATCILPPDWPCWAWRRAPLSGCQVAAGVDFAALPRTGAWSQTPDSVSSEKEEDNDGIIVCALPNVHASVWNSSNDAREHQKSNQILYPSADVRNDQCI